jgi:hypothetical protein
MIVIPGRIEDANPEGRDESSKLDLPGLVRSLSSGGAKSADPLGPSRNCIAS